MRTLLTTLCSIIIYHTVIAQDIDVVNAIEAEGRRLYRLEAAAWHGTDIFLQEFKPVTGRLKGYFAYADHDVTKAVFFSNEVPAKVLGTISFDTSFNIATALRDTVERNFTDQENDIYQLRETALGIVKTDTTFKRYKNTSLNLIPIIDDKQLKKVYVLTGPQTNGVVIFGNDYLINFDGNNKLLNLRPLHKNIISVDARNKEQKIMISMHTHLPETGDYITATDICTLLLYQKFTEWEQHVVMSPAYISIWNTAKSSLLVLTREAWERIYKSKPEN